MCMPHRAMPRVIVTALAMALQRNALPRRRKATTVTAVAVPAP